MIIRRNVKVYNLSLNSRFKSSTTRIFTQNLAAPAYKPEVVEANKYDEWESRGLFTAKNSSQEPVFSVVLPPPNVTGKLHLG